MSETKKITPFQYDGAIHVNTSKSYFQRALVIAMLAEGQSVLRHNGWSSDARAVCQAIRHISADVSYDDRSISIIPRTRKNTSIICHVGESGLALRMFSAVLPLFDGVHYLGGHGSLINRPIQPIISFLKALGVEVQSFNGQLPLAIKGPIQGNQLTVDGSFSSQLLTGLLIAAPLLDHDTEINVINLKSRPYIDMTLDIMASFGVDVTNENYEHFIVGGNQKYIGRTYTIEGDYSGAANHLVGAAISGQVCLNGLNQHSKQADRAILSVLKMVGASISWDGDVVQVTKNELRPFHFDATNCPDLFPPLVVLACACTGTSRITGIHRLTHKESDRLAAIMEQFTTLGAHLETIDDALVIHGTGELLGGSVRGYNDHRMVMSATIAACISKNTVEVDDIHAINKSYPSFFEHVDSVRTNQ